ncbi:MAG TPA: efflux RND transporter periplasmic adaptor subunit [Candidatus Limnocylindrales bacterium]|nr:efflux RND transporter periplasmic adaptor subunit [Candidatus Limnocylindrales bacterium]
MKWKVLAIVVLLAGGGLAVGASLGVFGASAATSTTDYLTADAAVADVVAQVAATGAVAPSATYGLAFGAAPTLVTGSSAGAGAATVTWPVTNVGVAVGDRVTKGQVLATAATTDLDAQIADANRSSEIAANQLATATDQYDLAKTTAAIRQARIGLFNAQTQDAHAQATLATLQAQEALATLTAPLDGVVTVVSIATGANAPSGNAIQIAADPLEVTTSVVESDIASITVGQTASVTVAALGGATLDGTVASIAPTGSAGGNQGVVSFAVAITLTNAPAGLRPGMSADVTITTATAPGVLAIPARALAGSLGAYRVRVLAADGTISTHDVTVGLITSSLVEVKSGLQAGDRVITGTSSSQNTTNRTGTFGGGGGLGGGGVIRTAP